MKDHEVIATLKFYEDLAAQLTEEAIGLALQCKALGYQLQASQRAIERRAKKRWWQR